MDPKSPEYLALAEYFTQKGMRLSRDCEDAYKLVLRPDHTVREMIHAAFLLVQMDAFNEFTKDVYAILTANSD